MNNDTPGVLHALRTATGALHQRLDSQLPLARPDATLADYLRHLAALQPWLRRMRSCIETADDESLGAVASRIDEGLAALESDLAHAASPAGAVAPADAKDLGRARCRTEPVPAAYAWGVAYVVEGSQLGGAVMYRRLYPRLEPHPMRYFARAGEGGGVGATWRGFVDAMASAVRSPEAVAAAQRGAVDAFEDLLPRFGLEPATGQPPESRSRRWR